jgi:hypothetical protein
LIESVSIFKSKHRAILLLAVFVTSTLFGAVSSGDIVHAESSVDTDSTENPLSALAGSALQLDGEGPSAFGGLTQLSEAIETVGTEPIVAANPSFTASELRLTAKDSDDESDHDSNRDALGFHFPP